MTSNPHGGDKHPGRHTGKYANMDKNQILSDRTVQELRETSDAVESLCQRLEGTYQKNRSGMVL